MKKLVIGILTCACLVGATAMVAHAAIIESGLFTTDRPGVPHGDQPFASRGNILVNPGFESGGLAPWTSAGWTVINSDQHTGTYSARGITNIWIRQDIAPTDVTTINAITVWEKQPSGIAFAAVDFIYTNDGDYDEFLVAPGADWTFIDMTAQLRPAGNLTAIRFWSYSGGGDQTTLIDDVTIDTDTPTPAGHTTWGAVKALYK